MHEFLLFRKDLVTLKCESSFHKAKMLLKRTLCWLHGTGNFASHVVGSVKKDLLL